MYVGACAPQRSVDTGVTNAECVGARVRSGEPFGDGRRRPSRARSAARLVLLVIAGSGLGVVGVEVWRHGWLANWNWTAVLAIAIFANVVTALVPVWREDRRRRRQA